MKKINRNQFQSFPYHLVEPSPWPILVSFSLLSLTLGAVMYMQGFTHGGQLISLGFTLTVFGMILWFRDIITEGTKHSNNLILNLSILFTSKVITKEMIKTLLQKYIMKEQPNLGTNEDLGHYLSGLLEGDGSIYLPSIGKTSLKRVLNPRIIFPSHINNLEMYLIIYNQLGNIGRFQVIGNVLRYIIGDVKGINFMINLIHGKLRTPKNIRLNQLIDFLNNKYGTDIKQSPLDKSDLYSNSWFTGFIEADGHFGIKISKRKIIQDLKINNVCLVFRLDQRAYDFSTKFSMKSIMKILADQLNCSLLSLKLKINKETDKIREVYSVSITSPIQLLPLIEYLNKYQLIGNKNKEFKDWEKAYHIIISKHHLTEAGYLDIMKIKENLNSKRQFINPLA